MRFSLAHNFFGAKIQILAKIYPIGLVTFFFQRNRNTNRILAAKSQYVGKQIFHYVG